MPYINMKTIITGAFAVIAIIIYRLLASTTGIIDSMIVGLIAGSIGGAIGAIYDLYLSRYDYTITDIFDNIIWFLLFCIPGALLGVIFSSLLFGDEETNGYVVTGVMFVVSTLLTLRKIKQKKKQKTADNSFFEFSEADELPEDENIVESEEKKSYALKHPVHIVELLLFFRLDPNTTDFSALKTSYKELLKMYHPDVGGSEELTKKIINNFKILESYFMSDSA